MSAAYFASFVPPKRGAIYIGNVIEKKSPNDTFSKIHFFAFSEKGANSAEFDDRIVQLYSH